jgi:hypothetical protein
MSRKSAPPLGKARTKVQQATTVQVSVVGPAVKEGSPESPVGYDAMFKQATADDALKSSASRSRGHVWVVPDGVRFVSCCKTHCRLGREAAEAKRRRVLKSLEASSLPSSSSCSGRRLRARQLSASFSSSF